MTDDEYIDDVAGGFQTRPDAIQCCSTTIATLRDGDVFIPPPCAKDIIG